MPRSAKRAKPHRRAISKANSKASGTTRTTLNQPLPISLLSALKSAAIKTYRCGGIGLAKEAAYSFILSFFPMIVALIAFFFLWGDHERSIAEVLLVMRRVLPTDSYLIVENYIKNMALNPSAKLFWFSLAGTFWTASGIMSSLQNALNIIYEVTSTRRFWMKQLMALLLVIGAGAPLVIATILTIFGDQLEHFLARKYGFDFIFEQAWSVGRWVIVLTTTVMIAAICYRAGVERKQSWRGVFPGAILATLLWLMATLLFNFYVQNFGSYNRVYGSLGAVIVLLIWMFITALSLLYGAAFNVEIERCVKE